MSPLPRVPVGRFRRSGTGDRADERRVGLGTSEVATYRSGWTKVGLGRKHDVAIVGNESQSVEAELKLVDACGRAEVPVFVLTDFDRQGFTIAENLRAGTWRHRYATPPKVVHVGLRLEQINDLGGLGSEQEAGSRTSRSVRNVLKHVSDDRLRECDATEAEVGILHARRVELNALSTEQLVDLVEGAIDEHGIEKVIPNTEDLAAAWRAAKAHAEIVKIIEKGTDAQPAAGRRRRRPTPR